MTAAEALAQAEATNRAGHAVVAHHLWLLLLHAVAWSTLWAVPFAVAKLPRSNYLLLVSVELSP